MLSKETKLRLNCSSWYSGLRSPGEKEKIMTTKTARTIRWLHLYISMLSFSALLFFSWTGITLNHPTWFGASQVNTIELQGILDTKLLEDPLDRLEVSETLRERHQLRGKVTEFLIADNELMLIYKGPAYTADVFISRSSGHYDLTETKHGATALLNDLHKGRDSGQAWRLMIDLIATVLIVMSLTGFGLLLFLKRRRAAGLIVALAGTVGLLFAWLILVP
jgi:hypothetical protein